MIKQGFHTGNIISVPAVKTLDNQYLASHSARCSNDDVLSDGCRADLKNQYSFACYLLSAVQDTVDMAHSPFGEMNKNCWKNKEE